eukprot:1775564-Karenia_brevis.AAC.1
MKRLNLQQPLLLLKFKNHAGAAETMDGDTPGASGSAHGPYHHPGHGITPMFDDDVGYGANQQM